MTALSDYQRRFIQLALNEKVLEFGDFTLKSGRPSPYFFNIARISNGESIRMLGECYAEAILQNEMAFDMLFGAAYKGISLVVTTAMALSERLGRPVPYSFNRKEMKTHGEGGQIIGPQPSGQVLIIDDVITAGTAMREVEVLLSHYDATVTGVVVAMNRQEKGQADKSAAHDVATLFACDVHHIINLDDIMAYVKHEQSSDTLSRLHAYRKAYILDED